MHRVKGVLIVVAALALVLAVGAQAQEHPQQEHPKEHPAKAKPAGKPISTVELEKAIRADIDAAAKANDGRFPAKDEVLNKTWQLELVRVHTDKLTALDASTYFACVDFKADDGTLVDVDFYYKNDDGQLKRTDTTVHKINGQARFNYEKKGDFWVRVPEGKKAEHPKGEHPKGEHPKP